MEMAFARSCVSSGDAEIFARKIHLGKLPLEGIFSSVKASLGGLYSRVC